MRGIDSIEDLEDVAADISGEIVDADSGRLHVREASRATPTPAPI